MKKTAPTRMVAITQPNFLPWIGYLEMIDRADLFVFLDDVQFPTTRKDWINRNRIKSNKAAGWDWVTVSIQHHSKPDKKICETLIAPRDIWVSQLIKKIKSNYSHYAFFADYAPSLFDLLDSPFELISDLNIAVIKWAMKQFGIPTPTIRSSALKTSGVKDDKLLAIVRETGGNFYLANNGSKPYIRPELFLTQGIDFAFQNYCLPSYKGYAPDNLQALSFVDLLFAEGPQAGLKIIRRGRPRNVEQIRTLGNSVI